MKNSKKFADLSKLVSKDITRPALNYAIVERGRLIATNSHALACIDLTNFADPQEMQFLENKVFSADLMKKLAAAKENKFFENHIICTGKNGAQKLNYTGRVLDRKIEIYNEIENEFKSVGIYPNWQAVVPGLNKDTLKIDISKLEIKAPAGYNAKLIDCISTSLDSDALYFLPNNAKQTILLKCLQDGEKELNLSDFCLLMPIIGARVLDDAMSQKTAEKIENTAGDVDLKKFEAEAAEQRKRAEAAEAKIKELSAEIENLQAKEAPAAKSQTKPGAKLQRKNRRKFLKY